VTLFKLLTNELPARAPREGDARGGTWLQRWEGRLHRWERCLVEQVRDYICGSVSTLHCTKLRHGAVAEIKSPRSMPQKTSLDPAASLTASEGRRCTDTPFLCMLSPW